jgi:release factor glutamine methyltransferase
MTLADRLRNAAAALEAAGVENPRREARLLLAHATGLDGAGLLRDMQTDRPAPGFAGMVARRVAREPLALITGEQPFWTFSVAVSPDTLVPRADSEALIEAALAAFPNEKPGRVLDLGTGTGCLLLAALLEFPGATGVGIDLSPAAAALARRNAVALGLDGRASLVCGDWAACLAGRFDLVLSNPPYIETADIAGLMPEVARYEPVRALDGGADGLAAYRVIISSLPGLLAPGGVAIFELGAGQEADVAALGRAAGLEPEPASPDLSGIARALPLWKKSVGEGADHR